MEFFEGTKSILVTDPVQSSGKFFIFSTLKEQNQCFVCLDTKSGGKNGEIWKRHLCLQYMKGL